jgi:hypothetical protein
MKVNEEDDMFRAPGPNGLRLRWTIRDGQLLAVWSVSGVTRLSTGLPITANGSAFNPSCFTTPPLGSSGNAPRRFFYGPGIRNTDLALIKVASLANHSQFYGADAVDGNINSRTFGSIVSAAAPRTCQVAMKVRF